MMSATASDGTALSGNSLPDWLDFNFSYEFYLYIVIVVMSVLVICLAFCLFKMTLSLLGCICSRQNICHCIRTSIIVAILFLLWTSLAAVKSKWQ